MRRCARGPRRAGSSAANGRSRDRRRRRRPRAPASAPAPRSSRRGATATSRACARRCARRCVIPLALFRNCRRGLSDSGDKVTGAFELPDQAVAVWQLGQLGAARRASGRHRPRRGKARSTGTARRSRPSRGASTLRASVRLRRAASARLGRSAARAARWSASARLDLRRRSGPARRAVVGVELDGCEHQHARCGARRTAESRAASAPLREITTASGSGLGRGRCAAAGGRGRALAGRSARCGSCRSQRSLRRPARAACGTGHLSPSSPSGPERPARRHAAVNRRDEVQLRCTADLRGAPPARSGEASAAQRHRRWRARAEAGGTPTCRT